jgi:hypothetical protein
MLMRRWERARKGDGQLVLIVAARGKLGPCSTPGGRLRWVESHRSGLRLWRMDRPRLGGAYPDLAALVVVRPSLTTIVRRSRF